MIKSCVRLIYIIICRHYVATLMFWPGQSCPKIELYTVYYLFNNIYEIDGFETKYTTFRACRMSNSKMRNMTAFKYR